MSRFLLIPLFLSLSVGFITAQKNIENGYQSPLGIPLVLASNFGELRPNHFHMGIDLKTEGRTGFNIYSIDNGYVSRVKVSAYGYGKVVYIDHPNGKTSVYAHCLEFKGDIDSLVKATQVNEQNYEVDIYPSKDALPVKKGQVIAISGNTGGSTAPHVHFEIRDTKTEHAMNPLLYGFDLADHKAPEIRNVKIYGITKDGYRYPDRSKLVTVSKGTEGYFISGNTLTIPASYLTKSGGIGLAFDVIDRLDGASNQCGLYGSVITINGDTIFGQQSKRIPFESTRYVNCHKDYHEYQTNKRKFHKCFKTTENDLPIYITEGNGVFHAEPGKTYKVDYVAYDVKGNRSTLSFDLVVSDGAISPDETLVPDLSYLIPGSSLKVEGKGASVQFGYASTYEPMKIDKDALDHKVGDAATPVHNAYRLFIDKSRIGKNNYVEFITAKGRRKTFVLQETEGIHYCEPNCFGTYSLKEDVTPPTIQSVNFSTNSTAYSRKLMQWKIADSETGINDYDLFIDGEWKLLEYDYKTGLVTFDTEGMEGEKDIKVIVKDEVGNTKEWVSHLKFL